MTIEQVPIQDLKPADYNPRKWDEKMIADLKASIQKFGLVDPIIVNGAPERKNIVIGGHFRLFVAKQMGFKEMPVVYVNIPDETTERELNLRLNRNTGIFDYDLLAGFNDDLLKSVGFSGDDLIKMFHLDDNNQSTDPTKSAEPHHNEINTQYCICPTCGKRHRI